MSWRRSHLAMGISLLLILSGWSIAVSFPLSRLTGEEILTTSVGRMYLINGAVPWLLQFAGLAILCSVVGRKYLGAHRGILITAIGLPLAWGLLWWAGIIATSWRMDLLELIGDHVRLRVAENLGAGPTFKTLLLESVGPTVNPLMLSGPGPLDGWSYLGTGLSTTLAIAYWMLAGKWTGVSEDRRVKGFPNWRQFGKMCLAVVGYIVVPLWLKTWG